jgi:hypothetical protein
MLFVACSTNEGLETEKRTSTMLTDTSAVFPPASSREIADPLDDDSAATQHGTDRHQSAASSDFAEQQAPNVLLAMGIVLFLIGCAGCAAAIIGNPALAAIFVGLGPLTVIFSGRLKGLVLLKLECEFGALLAKFGMKNATDSGSNTDDAPDALTQTPTAQATQDGAT